MRKVQKRQLLEVMGSLHILHQKTGILQYDIKQHSVWKTKYRKPIITGQIAIRTSKLVQYIKRITGEKQSG